MFNAFLNLLETHSGSIGLAKSARIFLDRKISDEAAASYRVTFIIAAYNASATIAETLDSLLAQTRGDWEAVIVNDGSKDNTVEIVQEYIERDGRFRLINQDNGGVSKARNTGLLAAKYDWTVFLDSDDMIEPNYLELMTGLLAQDRSIDVAYCEYCRLTPEGLKVPKLNWFDAEDIFEVSTHTCPVAAHGTVVRKALILEVGLLDTSLKTCEDWDLWQRIARTGAIFGEIKKPLAIYRMRPGSASNHGRQMLKDSLIVIERGHTPDPRVPHSDRRYVLGGNPRDINDKVLESSAWAAGLILGSGGDARVLLDLMSAIRSPNISPLLTAETIFESALLPRALKPTDGQKLLEEMGENLTLYLDALEKHNGAPNLAIRTRRALERVVLEHSPDVDSNIVGGTFISKINVIEPIEDFALPAEVQRANFSLSIFGTAVGTIALPVVDGKLSSFVLKDAIASESGRAIVAAYFRKTLYPLLSLIDADVKTGQTKIYRGNALITDSAYRQPNDPEGTKFWDKANNYIYWTLFLQEVWGRPAWTFDQFYSLRTPDRPRGIVSAQNALTLDVFEELPNVLVLSPSLELTITVAGTNLCTFSISTEGRLITSQEIRAWVSTACASELCAAVVRECIVGHEIEVRKTLRELGIDALDRRNDLKSSARQFDKVASSSSSEVVRAREAAPSAAIIARRPTAIIQGGSSRRAMLPASVLGDIEQIVGPTVYRPEDTDSVLYLPDASYTEEAVAKLSRAREEHAPNGRYLSDALTPGRGILQRKPQPLARAGSALRRLLKSGDKEPKNGIARNGFSLQAGASPTPSHLPILMYHRVAPFGGYKAARWRVNPQLFDDQMRYLVENGFRTITLEEWYNYKTVRKPMPQRTILLTFDDGFDDFAVYAWPILQNYGLGAINYLVSSLVGRANEWDAAMGESVPLMNWDTIKRLRDEGCEFGSHTCSHKHLTGLTTDEIAYELAHSRAVLQKELGLPITSIAYPFGDYDPIVAHIAGACGYDFAVTCDGSMASYESKLLQLPREEVANTTNIADYEGKVMVG